MTTVCVYDLVCMRLPGCCRDPISMPGLLFVFMARCAWVCRGPITVPDQLPGCARGLPGFPSVPAFLPCLMAAAAAATSMLSLATQSEGDVQWQCQVRDAWKASGPVWADYVPPINQQLEDGWKLWKTCNDPGNTGILTIINEEWDYNHTVKYRTFEQVHNITGTSRAIRRCLITAE